MTTELTALDAQHDSTAIETDAAADVDGTAVPTFGTEQDSEVTAAIVETCLLLSC